MTTPEPETYEEFMHPRGVTMRIYGLDTPESPMMRIEIWCEHCGERLSATSFDVRTAPLSEQVTVIVAVIGERDAEEALKHLETAHGV